MSYMANVDRLYYPNLVNLSWTDDNGLPFGIDKSKGYPIYISGVRLTNGYQDSSWRDLASYTYGAI
jgi:hypothetical protein